MIQRQDRKSPVWGCTALQAANFPNGYWHGWTVRKSVSFSVQTGLNPKQDPDPPYLFVPKDRLDPMMLELRQVVLVLGKQLIDHGLDFRQRKY